MGVRQHGTLTALACAASVTFLAGCTAPAEISNPTPVQTPLSLGESCEALSAVLEDLHNIDGRLENDAIDEREWIAQIEAAKQEAAVLGQQPHAEAQEEITSVVSAIEDIPAVPTGEYPASSSMGMVAAGIAERCEANGTDIIIRAEYGG